MASIDLNLDFFLSFINELLTSAINSWITDWNQINQKEANQQQPAITGTDKANQTMNSIKSIRKLN